MSLRDVKSGEELASLIGVNYKKQIVYYTYRHQHSYTTFEIPKKGGRGYRTIKVPIPPLAYIQDKLREHLDDLYAVRACVHGFVPHKDIVTNASAHKARRFVLNVDIEDFFLSIHHGRVAGALVGAGVTPAIAKLISHLCTHEGTLPQGASTSPVLSNIVCWSLDRMLLNLAKEQRCFYTRYADDITFSTFQRNFPSALAVYAQVDGVDVLQVGAELAGAVADAGFALNPTKTRLLTRDGRQDVTGLTVNDKVNVRRKYIRNIRAALHVWQTKGKEIAQGIFLEKYMRPRAPNLAPPDLEEHLRGKISHLSKVKGHDDSVYKTLRDRFNELSSKKIIVSQGQIPALADLIKMAVWVIQTEDEDDPEESAQGTAFFLEGVGLVTCEHCVSKKHKMVAFNPMFPARKYPVSTKVGNAIVDLAILNHEIPDSEYVAIEVVHTHSMKHGAEITLAGWPDFGPGDDITLRPGVVVGFKTVSTIQRIRLNLPVIYGNSGGPAFDSQGRLVGVAVTGAGTLAEAEKAKDNSLVPIGALTHIVHGGWPKKEDSAVSPTAVPPRQAGTTTSV